MNPEFEQENELELLRAAQRRLRAELVAERKKTRAVTNSFSFRVGTLLVRAFIEPGRNTFLLPFSIMRLALGAARRRRLPSADRTGGAKPYMLELVRERIAEIKQQSENRRRGEVRSPGRDLRIAVITDRFSYDCLKYEANLVVFTPENWRRVLEKPKPDLLFVESAWQGNDGAWKDQIVDLERKPNSQLPDLVRWFRARDIPTAFWCKEDPAHYRGFLEAARLFDHVYTSDSDCVAEYKRDLQHDRVDCLPFAVQPRIHNPVGSGSKLGEVAFAGSWYEGDTVYRQHRKEQMAHILEPALLYDVDIYDRFLSLGSDRYRFPEQYRPFIVGSLPYGDMVYAYRMYRVFLNVNSVIDSPTMFPRRVLEILASGTCVLSGYSRGIENMIGADTVRMPASSGDTRLCLQELLGNKELRDRLAHLGLRKVMNEHTYDKRLDFVIRTMGIGVNGTAGEDSGVSIVTCTNKLIYMDNIFANYERQRCDRKELIIVLNNDGLNITEWEKEAERHRGVRVYQLAERIRLGACLNFGVENSRYGHIAKFDDDDYYGPEYLADMLTAFNYSGADIVGKSAHYVYFEGGRVLAIQAPENEHCFHWLVAGPTLVIRREVFDRVRFNPDKGPGEDTQFLKDSTRKGFRVYSADRFNFARIRRAEAGLHTWGKTDDEQLAKCEAVPGIEDYVRHVTC